MEGTPTLREPDAAPSRPRRRRLAFGLRALMLLVLAVAAVLGWKVHRATVQKRAVARIEAAGGGVVYDFAFDGEWPYRPVVEPSAPAWLRRAIGDEFFQEVTAVSLVPPWSSETLTAIDGLDHLMEIELDGKALTWSDLTRLGRSKTIRYLSLNNVGIDDIDLALLANARQLHYLNLGISNRVDDAGLAHLRNLPELREFCLVSDGITGAGLIHLAGLPNLRTLRLGACKIDDRGLAHLAGLQGLRILTLSDNPITNVGLRHLEGLVVLEELALNGVRGLTDAGFVHLRGLKNLRKLNLSETKITDAGLIHLADLNRLEVLDLTSAPITDAGLSHLRGLPALRKIGLDNTKVSDEAKTAFLETSPNLSFLHETPPPLPPFPPLPSILDDMPPLPRPSVMVTPDGGPSDPFPPPPDQGPIRTNPGKPD